MELTLEEEPADLAALPYTQAPYIARRWVWDGFIPVGSPVILAAHGETGKGMLLCAVVARVVLGLPMPGEDETERHAPARVVWISGPGEDDLFEDLAPRMRAAIGYAVAEFGLDPALAGEAGAIGLVSDLSFWRDGNPVSLPSDCPRITAELAKVNEQGAKKGLPPVALVVADSLSALLSDGYTIDSRQGARRVTGMLARFARAADIALVVIHHMTKDHKVAGSPAVIDSVRLALRIERSKDNPDVRTLMRAKANISDADPVCYVITGAGPSTHAEFTEAADQRAERVRLAAEHSAPAEAPAYVPAADPRAERARAHAAADPGPFRLLRQVQAPGDRASACAPVGGPYATREDARAAAQGDAGAVLSWKPAERARAELAAYRAPDGTLRGYHIGPVASGTAS